MDLWMVGFMDCMDFMDLWNYGWMDLRRDGFLDLWIYGFYEVYCFYGFLYGSTDGWMDLLIDDFVDPRIYESLKLWIDG
jgi:hypothetical protein